MESEMTLPTTFPKKKKKKSRRGGYEHRTVQVGTYSKENLQIIVVSNNGIIN